MVEHIPDGRPPEHRVTVTGVTLRRQRELRGRRETRHVRHVLRGITELPRAGCDTRIVAPRRLGNTYRDDCEVHTVNQR